MTARRICILRHGFYPSDVRVRREANALVAAGFEVDLVVLRRPGQLGKEEVDGVTVYRLPLTHERSQRRLRYLFQYSASFALMGVVACALHLRRAYDLIQVNTMPDFLAFAALIPKLLGARLVLDVHDLMPEIYMTKFRVTPGHPLVRLLKLQEGASMALADQAITVIEELRQILVERHGQRDLPVIMNCPDPSVLPRRAPSQPTSRSDDRFVLLSHGVVVERLGYDTAIRAVALLQDRIPGIELRIVGPGDYVEELKKLANTLGVSSRVHFTGLVPLDVIPEVVAQADLGVVANKNNGSADLMLPTKLLEYAWLGKPAVVARTSTIAHYFDETMVSYFTPGDAPELAERILDLYRHPERRQALAVNAGRFFEEHNWATEAARYCALLGTLADGSNRIATRKRIVREILVTAPCAVDSGDRFRRLSPSLQVDLWPARTRPAVPRDRWRDVEVLYTSFSTPLPLPEDAPRLRWVQLYSAGPDAIVDHPLYLSPVVFTTASGVHAINLAEHVLAMMLAWFHRLPLQAEWQRQARWPSTAERPRFVADELRGKTVGIVGYGSIGRQVARLAHGFGMRILAMQRGADRRDHGFRFAGIGDPEGALPDRFYPPEQLRQLLGASDVVVLATPLTPRTRDLMDAAAFRAMKPTAFLVNIARGQLCDEAALVRALAEKQIAGAALDVFEQEPLPADNPLWRLPNVFISPHTAGLTPDYEERAATIFEENLRHYLNGEPLSNLVDKSRGY